ncbi:MAG: response regulator [Pseudomonadota bacterium]|nr:response regulator [Pseudomonadota bacterium]
MPTSLPRVLVVDKDAHVCRLLDTILPAAGYQAQFALDGYLALDGARLDPPAIVVTEILVPRLDGLALCRLLKGDESTRSTKVLVLSVLDAESRALAAGADRFMRKPIERTILVEALRMLAASSAPWKEGAE